MSTRRLDAEAWTRAALDVVAEEGLDAISVERLAVELGATKGSFYWHFANRDALVEAVLTWWERVATNEVIELLGRTSSPLERLRQLVTITNRSRFEDRIEAAINFSTGNPLATEVVERVTKQRYEFVVDAFRDLGYPRAVAERRAHICLSAYLGRLHLDRTSTPRTPAATRAYNHELLTTLTTDRPRR